MLLSVLWTTKGYQVLLTCLGLMMIWSILFVAFPKQAPATCNDFANCTTRESHTIGVIPENALKKVVFFVKYKITMSRIALDSLKPIGNFKKLITGMANPSNDTKAPKLTNKIIFEFFDKLFDFLNENIGSVSEQPLC